MSISSWLRMCQWKTYSKPKLASLLVVVGFPLSTLLNPLVSPSGIIGLSGRMLFGISNGSFGMIGRRATIVSSTGLILTRCAAQARPFRAGSAAPAPYRGERCSST